MFALFEQQPTERDNTVYYIWSFYVRASVCELILVFI